MSRHATSFVLGYHGCRKSTAEEVIAGRAELVHSDKDYDWLGAGAYFWEHDAKRAKEWAEQKFGKDGAVIGAVIDLGNCLDLVSREDLEFVRKAHPLFLRFCKDTGTVPPVNSNVRTDANGDILLRRLDCVVINYLNKSLDEFSKTEKYDTVRGMFLEGAPLYDGSAIRDKTHVQIAVRNNDVIKGFFFPRHLK